MPLHADPATTVGARELIGLRDVSGLSLSPDGSGAVYQLQQADLARDGYRSLWCHIDLDTGRIRELGDAGDIAMPVLAGLGRRTGMWMTLQPRWRPDGRALAMLARRGDQTFAQVCTLGRTGCRTLAIDGDIQDFIWSEDGAGLIVSSTRSTSELSTARAAEADTGFHFDDRFDVFHALTPMRGFQSAPELHFVDAVSGRVRPVHAEEIERFRSGRRNAISTTMGAGRSATVFAAAPVERPPFLRDLDVRDFIRLGARGAAWTAPARTDASGSAPPLALFASRDASQVRCSAPECEGYIVEIAARDEDTILFIRREGWGFGAHGVYLWDLAANSVRPILVSENVIRVCTPRRTNTICLFEGPTSPRRIVALDYASGALRTLVDPNPDLPQAAFAPARRIEWTSPLGDQVFGYVLTPPDRAGPNPLIVVQYRATGFLRGGVGDEYPIQAFVRAGFAVLALERPDPFALRAFVRDADEIDRREWEAFSERRRTLAALTSGIEHLAAMGLADPERVGVTGLSDGAETAVFGLIHCDCIAAAAISSGVHDPMSYYLTSDRQRAAMRANGRAPSEEAFWNQMSLSRNAEGVNAPILAQVADREALFMLQAHRTFADLGKPFDVYIFPDEYHVKWRPRHRLAIYQRSLRWFRFWLLGEQDSAPAFADEYARWRAWRDASSGAEALGQVAQPSLNAQQTDNPR